MSEPSETWLPQEAFEKLSAELDRLKTDGRRDVSARIAAARAEGDLSENGGYHAAREEQGQLEARITMLEQMLREAQVGNPTDTGTGIQAGFVVTAAINGGAPTRFLLGSREMLSAGIIADDLAVYSPQSPLGAAVIGCHPADTVSYTAPTGKEFTVEILDAQPFSG
ncbi:MAG: transcription elongation factor GreA [Propionibacteriaceae bacterium]|jgi:transcription elongation factor GreA|nr:transcription elongation factor GreA [Propionibacteriaceae bacterium]